MSSCAESLKRIDLRLATGICLTLCVNVLWTVATFISQYLVTGSATGQGHRAVDPFVFTYLGTTLFVLFLPILAVANFVRRQLRSWIVKKPQGHQPDHALLGNFIHDEPKVVDTGSHSQSLTAALWLTPLWFLGNWSYNISLQTTSVTSNTILSQTSSLFTFAYSIWLLSERYTTKKLVCVVLALAGVVLVTVKDGETGGDGSKWSAFGDVICLFAAAVYGMFVVVLRWKVGDEHTANLPLVFGFIGLFTTIWGGLVIALLLWSGVYSHSDVFMDKRDLLLIGVEGLLDNVLADVLQAQSVLLLGPTLATLGLSFTIPMAAYWEVFQISPRPEWSRKVGPVLMTVAGTLFILAGFWGVTRSDGVREGPRDVRERDGGEEEEDSEQYPLVKGGGRCSGEQGGQGEGGWEGGDENRVLVQGSTVVQS